METGHSVIPSTDLFSQQYYITAPEWNSDSQAITFEYNQRGHQVYRVLEFSAATGKVRPLIEETSDKYVNYSRRFRHDLQNGKRMIWMSERDNWNHLYMYDRTTAQPIRQITKGEWYVRDILRVDAVSYTHLDVYKRQVLQQVQKAATKIFQQADLSGIMEFFTSDADRRCFMYFSAAAWIL